MVEASMTPSIGQPEGSASNSSNPGSRPKKVLVVDDDHSIVELLTLVLQDAGYEVVPAGDGHEAIVTAIQQRPDVIILDIVMPGLNGWEVSDHLLSHEQTASTPILFLTARVRTEDQLRGWYAGCFDYITKPFEVDQLLKQVRVATEYAPEEIRRMRDDLRRQRIAVLSSDKDDSSPRSRISDHPPPD